MRRAQARLLLAGALDDELVGILLVLAGLDALSRLAPRRHGSRHTNGALALAAAVRVIAGVHNYAADTGTHAHMANAAGLTKAYVLVVAVADAADSGAGVERNLANFAGGQTNLSNAVFLSHQLSGVTGRTNHLATLAGLDLNVVDQSTERDVGDGQAVAGLDVGVGAGHNSVADLQVERRQDVALFTIGINEQRDERGAVRIVLDRSNAGGDVVLVALEVDDTILTAVAAALMANGDLTAEIAARVILNRSQQGLFRSLLGQLLKGQNRRKAPRGGSRLINANTHEIYPP